jgi:hypothetical protein
MDQNQEDPFNAQINYEGAFEKDDYNDSKMRQQAQVL